ncbi:MAG: hypothetical protein HQ530_00470 [Parcubacteria group bacterium]|nr:hypothetical protein [Parcubacteria group bacterium]
MSKKFLKPLYLLATTVLGLLLSFIIHASLELLYLYLATSRNYTITWNSYLGKSCALPLWLQITLIVAGLAGGLYMGTFWYKMVYIEGRHPRYKPTAK